MVRLVKFVAEKKSRAGIVEDDGIREFNTGDFAEALELLADDPTLLSVGTRVWNPHDLALLPPIGSFARIFAIAQNYPDHAFESGGPRPSAPVFFLKPVSALASPNGPVRLPTVSKAFDYEGELGVLIGRKTHNASEEVASAAIAGYTICNDGSARDLGTTELGGRSIPDWFSAKAIDRTAPVGPHVIPRMAIRDPQALRIRTRLNGKVVQSDTTASMTFSIAEQIQFISRRVELLPGDLVMSGTPGGVGKARGRYLQPGDVVEVDISEIGVLSTTYVAHLPIETSPVVDQ